jgi:GTP cyclohydrolase I
MAKALLECTSGYALDPVAILQSALFEVEAGGGMVVVRDIDFHSLCEHHVLPFFGKVHVAYIPASKVVGLSKFARAVDALAKRLQVQERITRQLAEAIQAAAGTEDVAIITEAE